MVYIGIAESASTLAVHATSSKVNTLSMISLWGDNSFSYGYIPFSTRALCFVLISPPFVDLYEVLMEQCTRYV